MLTDNRGSSSPAQYECVYTILNEIKLEQALQQSVELKQQISDLQAENNQLKKQIQLLQNQEQEKEIDAENKRSIDITSLKQMVEQLQQEMKQFSLQAQQSFKKEDEQRERSSYSPTFKFSGDQ